MSAVRWLAVYDFSCLAARSPMNIQIQYILFEWHRWFSLSPISPCTQYHCVYCILYTRAHMIYYYYADWAVSREQQQNEKRNCWKTKRIDSGLHSEGREKRINKTNESTDVTRFWQYINPLHSEIAVWMCHSRAQEFIIQIAYTQQNQILLCTFIRANRLAPTLVIYLFVWIQIKNTRNGWLVGWLAACRSDVSKYDIRQKPGDFRVLCFVFVFLRLYSLFVCILRVDVCCCFGWPLFSFLKYTEIWCISKHTHVHVGTWFGNFGSGASQCVPLVSAKKKKKDKNSSSLSRIFFFFNSFLLFSFSVLDTC